MWHACTSNCSAYDGAYRICFRLWSAVPASNMAYDVYELLCFGLARLKEIYVPNFLKSVIPRSRVIRIDNGACGSLG